MKRVTPEALDELSRYLNMIVYGEPGTGKTTLGASAALSDETAPVLFCDYRSQIGSLRGNDAFRKAIEDNRLIIVTLDKYSELNHVYHWLSKGRGSQQDFDGMMSSMGYADDVMPKTIVVDSITELQRAEVMRRAGNAPGQFLSDVQPPEIRDWGSLLNQFTLLAHLFFNLPYHIMFAGLESVDVKTGKVGEAPQITGYRLAMQGQAKRQFPAYAMTLMRLERAPRNNEGVFNIGLTKSVMAKTKEQTGLIPAKIPNPTLPKLVAMLNGR